MGVATHKIPCGHVILVVDESCLVYCALQGLVKKLLVCLVVNKRPKSNEGMPLWVSYMVNCIMDIKCSGGPCQSSMMELKGSFI